MCLDFRRESELVTESWVSCRKICTKALALNEDRYNTQIQKRNIRHKPWKLLKSRDVGKKKIKEPLED